MYRHRYGSRGSVPAAFPCLFILQHGGGISRFCFRSIPCFPPFAAPVSITVCFMDLNARHCLTDIVQINTCRWLGCRLLISVGFGSSAASFLRILGKFALRLLDCGWRVKTQFQVIVTFHVPSGRVHNLFGLLSVTSLTTAVLSSCDSLAFVAFRVALHEANNTNPNTQVLKPFSYIKCF